MLRPQDTATRERRRLDGLWDFRLDAAGEGRPGSWQTGPLRGASRMPVPATHRGARAGGGVTT